MSKSLEQLPDSHLIDFLKTIPNFPGVYRMYDKLGKILYVGKAINLKRRVSSYFQKNDLSPRIQLMVKQVTKIEITVTRSEAEALILENNLIKSLSPKYNILFRDDKSYPYLMITGHRFPQIAYYRGPLKENNQYFGPYPNSHAVRDSIQIIQKVFQLRTCEDSVFEHRDRPCLLHQIHRCSAPCVNQNHSHLYHESVSQAVDFLNGKTDELTASLRQKMQTAADQLDFEQAAKYRDQIQALGLIQSQQFIDSKHSRSRDIDIIALVELDEMICIHWVSIRNGRHIGDKNFFPDTHYRLDETLHDYGYAFITQHYLGKNKPDTIISNFQLPENIKQILNAEHHKQIEFVHKTLGERKVWLDMAIRNATLALQQKQQQQSNQHLRLIALAELLQTDVKQLNRIECFDISHSQGEATVASCVVYENEAIQPNQYRRYNITTTNTGDDYMAMHEVLMRRYAHPPFPDLVLIDGGKGQVHIAQKVWAELNIDIPIIGISKGEERKAGLEELIIPHLNLHTRLPHHHPALHLLQTIRDESHRFAITGHRHKRAKTRVTSSLNNISGIGPKRKKALLTRFGGLRGITAASIEDLEQVEGISQTLAEKIYHALH